MSDTSVDSTSEADGPLPEFRIIVKHPSGRGPIGPYRLLIAVAVVALVLGPSLYSMLSGQLPNDMVLLRAAGIGLLVWITTGVADSALASAEAAGRSRPGSDQQS